MGQMWVKPGVEMYQQPGPSGSQLISILCLTEDLIQHRDWHNAGADQLVKYITGAHTL